MKGQGGRRGASKRETETQRQRHRDTERQRECQREDERERQGVVPCVCIHIYVGYVRPSTHFVKRERHGDAATKTDANKAKHVPNVYLPPSHSSFHSRREGSRKETI